MIFRKRCGIWPGKIEEDDATPTSLANELDEVEEVKEILQQLPAIEPGSYDLRQLHEALQHGIEQLTEIWHEIKDIKPENDAKLARLKSLLAAELKGEKVLLFTHYKDTARYLYRELGGDKGKAFRQTIDNPVIRRMDSGAKADERSRIIMEFAPKANNHPELIGAEKEIDILISTDVLSEGRICRIAGIW